MQRIVLTPTQQRQAAAERALAAWQQTHYIAVQGMPPQPGKIAVSPAVYMNFLDRLMHNPNPAQGYTTIPCSCRAITGV